MRGRHVSSLLEASCQILAHAVPMCEALGTLVAIRLDCFQSTVPLNYPEVESPLGF